MAMQNKNKKSGTGHGGQLVKYVVGKHKFEVLTNAGSVLKYRADKLSLSSVLTVDQIYTNFSRGDKASSNDLHDAFNTEDIMKCCEEIIKKGELQYSPQERKQFLEAKTNEIIYFINKNYMNPKNKLPHPSDRIAHCIKECKIRIDPNGDTKRQAEDCVKKMRGKLMFAKAVLMTALLTIKHAHTGQCTNLVHKIANVTHEEWTGEGCVYTIELSKADLNSLQVALMKPTNGDYNMSFIDDTLNTSNVSTSDTTSGRGGKKNKKKKDKKKKKKHKGTSGGGGGGNNDDNTEQKNDTNDTSGKNDKNKNKKDKKDKKDKKKKKKKHKSGGQQ